MKYCRKENIRKNILGKVSISNSFFFEDSKFAYKTTRFYAK